MERWNGNRAGKLNFGRFNEINRVITSPIVQKMIDLFRGTVTSLRALYIGAPRRFDQNWMPGFWTNARNRTAIGSKKSMTSFRAHNAAVLAYRLGATQNSMKKTLRSLPSVPSQIASCPCDRGRTGGRRRRAGRVWAACRRPSLLRSRLSSGRRQREWRRAWPRPARRTIWAGVSANSWGFCTANTAPSGPIRYHLFVKENTDQSMRETVKKSMQKRSKLFKNRRNIATKGISEL